MEHNYDNLINQAIKFYNINWWNNKELLYFAINYFVLWSRDWKEIFIDKLDRFYERENEVKIYKNYEEASKKYHLINPTIVHTPHYNIESKQTNSVVESPKRREFVIWIPLICFFG